MSVAIAPKRRLPTFPGNEQGSVFETFNKIGKRLVPYADLQCLKKPLVAVEKIENFRGVIQVRRQVLTTGYIVVLRLHPAGLEGIA